MIGLPDPKWIEAVSAVVVVKSRTGARCRSGASRIASSSWPRFKVPKRVVFVDSAAEEPERQAAQAGTAGTLSDRQRLILGE